MHGSSATRNPWIKTLVIFLLLAAAGGFLLRGPIRFVHRQMTWNDFLSPYIQADAWVRGKDPYCAGNIVLLWPPEDPRPDFVAREAADGSLPAKRGIPSLYPVTSLALLAPLTFLKWTVAETLWIAINTILLLLALVFLIAISGVSWRSLRVQFFLAAALALAPLHTGLATGNPAVLAIALTAGAVWADRRHKVIVSGILLALAVCLKPTIALAFVLYLVVCRHWRVVAVASAVTALIAAVAAGWLRHERIAWLASYFDNNRKILASGGLADFTSADPLRFNLVNTQVLFYSLFGSVSLAQWLSFFLAAALLAVWLSLSLRHRSSSEEPNRQDGFLEISSLFVLSLLPVYHRFYDAGLLLWPLAWTLLMADRGRRQLWTMLAIAPFFAPGAAFLDRWTEQGRIPQRIAHRGWWNMIVMPHEIWSLIALSILLLLWMNSKSRPAAGQEPSVR